MLFERSEAVSSRPLKAGVLLMSFALIATPLGAHAAPLAMPAPAGKSQLAVADSTDFGARKRIRRGGRGGNAAGLAMMGMMIGAVGGMIAAQQRREAYEAAYNRAYAAQYPYGYAPQPYGYAQPQPYAYHQPHVHHRPHVHHHHHAGHLPRMVGPFVNKQHFHR